MEGYKGFNADLKCRDFQYEVGQTYYMDPSSLQMYYCGFHFCKYATDVFLYYKGQDKRYAKVKAIGRVIEHLDKAVTNEITIVELLTYDQMLNASTGCLTRPNGTQEWYVRGLHHRDDGPAIVYPSGRQEWCYKGLPHRADGPAIMLPNGDQKWYYQGRLHRSDGPAINKGNGYQEWWIHGKFIKSQLVKTGD